MNALGILIALLFIDGLLQSVYFVFDGPKVSLTDHILLGIIMLVLEVIILRPLFHYFGKTHPSFKFVKINWVEALRVVDYILVIMAGNVLLSTGNALIFGKTTENANQATIESLATPSMIFGLVLMVVFLAPFIEELMFRGLVIDNMLYGLPDWVKIGLSGVAFGLFHVIGTDFQWFALIQYSFMGIMLGHAYVKTNRLQTSIMVHMGNNLIGAVPLVMMAIH